ARARRARALPAALGPGPRAGDLVQRSRRPRLQPADPGRGRRPRQPGRGVEAARAHGRSGAAAGDRGAGGDAQAGALARRLRGLADYFMEFTPTYGLFWLLAAMLAAVGSRAYTEGGTLSGSGRPS